MRVEYGLIFDPLPELPYAACHGITTVTESPTCIEVRAAQKPGMFL